MYRVVAGLDKSQPGYKHIVIQPKPGGHLSHARASYQSVYGEIVSGWEIQNGVMRVQVTIPPNTTATIRLPGANIHALQKIPTARQDGQAVIVEVGSGSYDFEYPYLIS
jgi:alpha-L-rhamnosidase